MESEAAHQDECQVERVDLSDDRLAPERVREGEKKTSGDAGRQRFSDQRAQISKKTDGGRTKNCGEQIEAAGRVRLADGTHERSGEVVVQRIGLPGAHFGPQHRRLKAAGVAEVDAWEERLRIRPECDRRDDRRGDHRRRAGSRIRDPGPGGASIHGIACAR